MVKAASEMTHEYLADLEEIRQLGHRYVNLCDDGFDAGPLADLFTADGIWQGPEGFGPYEGREALVGFFTMFGGLVLSTPKSRSMATPRRGAGPRSVSTRSRAKTRLRIHGLSCSTTMNMPASTVAGNLST